MSCGGAFMSAVAVMLAGEDMVVVLMAIVF